MPEDSRITLAPEEMRRLGYRVVDMVVEHLAALHEEPVTRRRTRAELEAALGGPPPPGPTPAEEVLDLLAARVLDGGMRIDHPRFFAFVPNPSNYVGALGDFLASGFNVYGGTWVGNPGSATLELVTTGWLRDICGMPASTAGVLASGGSVANLLGLAVVLHGRERSRAAFYSSEQTHSCVQRALDLLGVEHQRRLAVDAAGRLEPAAVRAAVERDREEGLEPACVVATAGTTSTGAVDPLGALRALCDEHGLWLHADGAYGAPAAACAKGRAALEGLGAVDSLVLDPHKWLFQPLELGCLLVRDGAALERAFAVMPAYLRDAATREGEVNFADRGIQLSRSARAIKLWMSLKVFGLDAFAAAIERGIGLAEHAEALLRERPGWEVVTPATLGIVTFRREGADALNAGLSRAVIEDGYAALSSTVVGGRTVLRLCTINPRTTIADLTGTIERMERLAGCQ